METAPVTARTVELTTVSKVWIEPSIMCADAGHLAAEVRRLEEIGVHALHFDIMDAHFVPNMQLGLGTIEQIRPLTALPFEECEHNGLLLALCHDIYAARQDGNLEIEWLAYRLLIDIYRSPADLRELTSGTLPGLFSRDHSD